MGDPKGFMKYAREGPKRKPVELRVLDWKEMYEPISEGDLKAQGARCMDCGVPFCQGNTGCPVVNLIPEWNDLAYRGRWKDALKALHTTNNFPEFTGRLCPAPCEGACVLGINEDPVSIRILEWNIIDRGFNEGYVEPVLPLAKTGKTVAIVGSGPAGMAAAQQLVRVGHSVTLFEKADRIGGLLRYGIPDFKMEKWVIDRRLEQM
jgi:glutamate synthase (NADPH/NADH) small chain